MSSSSPSVGPPRPPAEAPASAITAAGEVAAAGRIPGLVFAVARPTGLAYAGAVGQADLASGRPSTTQDQYLWFSMSKIATATAAVRLHADGALDLDAPVGAYLRG